jgi:hypothetical protein
MLQDLDDGLVDQVHRVELAAEARVQLHLAHLQPQDRQVIFQVPLGRIAILTHESSISLDVTSCKVTRAKVGKMQRPAEKPHEVDG